MSTYPSKYDPNTGLMTPNVIQDIPDFAQAEMSSGEFTDKYMPSDDFTNGLAERVKNSPPYQLAYSIFSKLSDKSWLHQLEMIPYSSRNADSFFGDSLTQSDEQRDDAAYQYCIEKIEQLYQSYRQYVQDLPLTQRQQLAAAGIYDASSISGASISPSGSPTANPSSVQLYNPTLDIIGRVGDAIFNANGGALSWFNALTNASNLSAQRGFDSKRLTLAREQFSKAIDSDKSSQALQYFDLAANLLAQGYSNVPVPTTFISDEVTDFDVSRLVGDSAAKNLQNIAEINNRTSAHQLAATPDITDESLAVMQTYNDYMFQTWQIQLLREQAIAERDKLVAQYESGMASGASGNAFEEGKYIAELNKRIAAYESRLADHRKAYMEGLYEQGKTNSFARYAYGYMMSGYDLNSAGNQSRMTNYQIDRGWNDAVVGTLPNQ